MFALLLLLLAAEASGASGGHRFDTTRQTVQPTVPLDAKHAPSAFVLNLAALANQGAHQAGCSACSRGFPQMLGSSKLMDCSAPSSKWSRGAHFCAAQNRGHQLRGRDRVALLAKDGERDAGERNEAEATDFNAGLYEELRARYAVMEGGDSDPVLPNPDMTPQQVISEVLVAMKATPKIGCRVFLRFLSDQSEYAQLTPQELESSLRQGGQTAVLLGNFRSFSFPTPTFEERREDGARIAVQEVSLFVPGFLAAMMGASRGWDARARLRWQLSRHPTSKAWVTDSVDLVPPVHLSS